MFEPVRLAVQAMPSHSIDWSSVFDHDMLICC
jgi:hypothetical protein